MSRCMMMASLVPHIDTHTHTLLVYFQASGRSCSGAKVMAMWTVAMVVSKHCCGVETDFSKLRLA